MKPNITLSLGLRYEIQQNIPDHGDWAPRIGLAWGIGPSQGTLRTPKTVLRAGFGYSTTGSACRTFSRRSAITASTNWPTPSPIRTFFPAAARAGIRPPRRLRRRPTQSASATYHIDSNYQAPTAIQQAAIGIDRQLPKNVTMSIKYINSIGHAPVAHGGYQCSVSGDLLLGPGTGVYPLGTAAGIYNVFQSERNLTSSNS